MAVGQKINTPAELSALPHGTVVVFDDGQLVNVAGQDFRAVWTVQMIGNPLNPSDSAPYAIGQDERVDPNYILTYPGVVVYEV